MVALDLQKQNMCESDHLYGRSQLLVSSTKSEQAMNYDVSESNAATTTTTTATVNQQPTSAPEEWSVGEQETLFHWVLSSSSLAKF